MKPILKSAWQKIVIGLIRSVEWLSLHLPSSALLRLGAFSGALAYRFSSRYRRVALKNLQIAYDDFLSIKDKLRITRAVFVNFAKAAVEFPLAARMSDDEIKKLVEFKPEDIAILRELQQRHGSILAISAHFGNFELMARRYVAEGFRLSVVVRNDDNPAVADMLNTYRNRTGYDVIPRGSAIRAILKKMRSAVPETVVMLPDQKSDDLFVPFFGKLAGTVAGPALIAIRVGKPIVPVFCVRLPGDKHRLIFGELIEPDPSAAPEVEVERLMTRINFAIEVIVREYPEQWLWLHDRWRGQPPQDVVERWESRAETSRELMPV